MRIGVDVDVAEIDPTDEDALREWWEVEQVAARADRPHALLRSWATLRNSVQQPGAFYRRHLLAARSAGRIVGVAELGLPQRENTHLADIEVNVVSAHRRQGVGTRLARAADERRRSLQRTTVACEGYVAAGQDLIDSAVGRFAASLGMASVHEEDHLVLSLPLDADRLARLRAAVAEPAAAYDVVGWTDRCPDEYAAAYCAMRNQMAQDVPTGEADAEAAVWDVLRLRESEEGLLRSYHTVAAAVRERTSGRFAGYSLVFVPHDEADALQDDTLVMPADRGHRLGMMLKLATHDALRREHPDVTSVHTWTEPDNAAMIHTNAAFGFDVAERMHLLQRRDDR